MLKKHPLHIMASWLQPRSEGWVLQLASRLRENRVHVCLDRWDVTLGGNLAHFMERAADDPYHVVAVVSETYSSKCNGRSDGAGVETQMLSELSEEPAGSRSVP